MLTKCPDCGKPLKKTTKKERATGGGSCALELIGLIILITTFWTGIGAIIGILFIYLGHRAAYTYTPLLTCPTCKKTIPPP